MWGGSPPRMWGKVSPNPAQVLLAMDHPHVCGEKFTSSDLLHVVMGSPPRMWGKVDAKRDMVLGSRITPTYVGKSVPCSILRKR